MQIRGFQPCILPDAVVRAHQISRDEARIVCHDVVCAGGDDEESFLWVHDMVLGRRGVWYLAGVGT
jgi:hypothetical protein